MNKDGKFLSSVIKMTRASDKEKILGPRQEQGGHGFDSCRGTLIFSHVMLINSTFTFHYRAQNSPRLFTYHLSCIVFGTIGHLWRHKHASHYEKEEVQKKYTSDKFVCNFDGCVVTFDTQPELVEHVKTHTTDKACMCNECGATFVSLPNLAKHTRRRHGDQAPPTYKGYRCEKCDKTFLTSYQLVVHFR